MNEAKSQKAVPGYNAATGTSNPGFDKFSTKYSGNQHTKTNPDAMINKGRGPTGGSTKVPAGKEITMGCHQPQVRTPGGTRAFDPKAGQNYKGDPNKINVGRGPTKGNE